MSTPTPVPSVGQGSTISYQTWTGGSTPPTGTYLSLGVIDDITPPSFDGGEVESTNLQSTLKDYVPTIGESTAGFKVQLQKKDPTPWTFRDQATAFPQPFYWFRVTMPDGGYDTFLGFVKSWKPEDLSNTSLMLATVEIRVKIRSVYTPPPASN